MATQLGGTKRWRPRFSVRTLIVLITLASCYLACWRMTATVGVVQVIDHVYGIDDLDAAQIHELESGAWTPVPMIVRLDEQHSVGLGSIVQVRRYYFWYFVGAVRLPFQGEDPPIPAIG